MAAMIKLTWLTLSAAVAVVAFGTIVDCEGLGSGRSKAAHTSDQAVAKEMLDEPIVLKEEQSGFAGVTGVVWSIEPDGRWKAQKVINEKTMSPHAEGQLDVDAAGRLRTLLAETNFAALPSVLGDPPPMNPKTMTVQVGAARKTAVLPGGWEGAGDCGPADLPLCRMLAVAAGIKAAIGAE